jgi:hypothetical protein
MPQAKQDEARIKPVSPLRLMGQIGKHQGEYYKFYGYIDDQLPKLLKKVKK